MAKADIHEGRCRTCGTHFRRNLSHVDCKNATQEGIFCQIMAVMRPYCDTACLPPRLRNRLKVLLQLWEEGQQGFMPRESYVGVEYGQDTVEVACEY